WKSVLLIFTVGTINGAGWALCQNWKWAPSVWQNASFNWWRCWESSGGISIGIAYGVAYFLANGRMSDEERAIVRSRRSIAGPNLEWLVVYLGLTALFGALVLSGNLWLRIDLGLGLVFGVLYYFLRRGPYRAEPAPPTESCGDPNLARLGLYL